MSSQVVDDAVREVLRLRAINAELCDALKGLLVAWETDDVDEFMDAAETARAALKKAEVQS